ncbi:MAG TPA: hypothetical protein VFL85_00975 [Candidatus Saccharimonadales bacterium]|nr:hypothetical protein [Candidatus Saccharimonadales bacterium]
MNACKPDLTLRDKLSQVYSAAREDYGDSSVAKNLSTAAAVGGLAFEWGFGNETLLGTVAGNVQQLAANSVVTGLATGAASFAEQGAIGVLMAAAIHNHPKITAAIRETVADGEERQAYASRIKRFGNSMLFGAAVDLALENAKNQHSRAANIRRALGSSAMIATANTAFIAGVSTAATFAAEHGLEAQVNTGVEVVSNPLTYVGVFASIVGGKKIIRVAKDLYGRIAMRLNEEMDDLEDTPRQLITAEDNDNE